MKNILALVFLFVIAQNLLSQKGITFKVEELDPPSSLLKTEPYINIVAKIAEDNHLNVNTNIACESNLQKSLDNIVTNQFEYPLVNFGTHPFLQGMHRAYAEHRPFVLSPDIIWLLICQGFSHHINYNSEALRHLLVDFDDKKELVVTRNTPSCNIPVEVWESVFPEFESKIADYVGEELTEAISGNFSTTTAQQKVAFNITLLNSMKAYFEYKVVMVGCGIPEITLEGTPEDWEKLLEKAKYLSKYELDWWINRLIPTLEEFVKASRKQIDKNFWLNMFKVHTAKSYGAPKNIDGWITDFFPYNKDGQRINLRETKKLKIEDVFKTLPNEVVAVNFHLLIKKPEGDYNKKMLFWAGFMGLNQNEKNYALKPEIGWFISPNITQSNNTKIPPLKGEVKVANIQVFPDDLSDISKVESLSVHFKNKIKVSDKLNNTSVPNLYLYGSITPEEILNIKKQLPHTKLVINGTEIGSVCVINTNQFPKEEALSKPREGITIYYQDSIIINNTDLTELDNNNLWLNGKTSQTDINRIWALMPANCSLTINGVSIYGPSYKNIKMLSADLLNHKKYGVYNIHFSNSIKVDSKYKNHADKHHSQLKLFGKTNQKTTEALYLLCSKNKQTLSINNERINGIVRDNVSQFPTDLLKINYIPNLTLNYNDVIAINERGNNLHIGTLRINGITNKKEKLRLKLFNTKRLYINNKYIELRRNNITEFPSDLLNEKRIPDLTLSYNDSIIIPNKVANINIKKLTLKGKTSPQNIERIRKLLPNTVLVINNRTVANTYLTELTKFPNNLKTDKSIHLIFKDSIDVSENIALIISDELKLQGNISKTQIEQIRAMLPEINLTINNEQISEVYRTNLTEFPNDLIKDNGYNKLTLYYKDAIVIDKDLASAKIRRLYLHGKITTEEKEQLRNTLPRTYIDINGKELPFVFRCNLESFPNEILKEQLSSISLYFNNKIKIPNELAQYQRQIYSINLWGEITDKEITEIRELLETRTIHFNGVKYESWHREKNKRTRNQRNKKTVDLQREFSNKLKL